jgi:hypothetical protein
MSRTTPLLYYEHFVVPNFEDYLVRPDDIRLGFNAVLPAFQLSDVMFAFYQDEDASKISQWPELQDFKNYLADRQPYFRTIQSLATAYKHLRLTDALYEVGSPGAMWSLTLPREDFDLASSWSDERPRGDVIVQRLKGLPTASLTQALTAVVKQLWPAVLPAEAS